MPAPKYLKQRNGVWYVQMRVPANLRPQLGATLIESLKTRDEAEANRKRHAVIAKFQARISEAEGSAVTNTTTGRLEGLLERACALFESEGASTPTSPFNPYNGRLSQARVDLEAEVDLVIDSYPVDRFGEPDVPAQDLDMIRRINAAAEGQADQMLDALAKRWLSSENERGRMKPSTLIEKRTHLDRFLDYVGRTSSPAELTQQRALGYVEDILNPLKISLARKQFILQTANQFCRWLRIRGLLKGDPCKDLGTLLRADKQVKIQRKTWKPEELSSFLQSVPVLGDIWVLTVLMAYTGARPQELCMIQREHVTNDAMTIPASKTKAGLRTIPIHPVIRPLVAHLAATTPDGYLISGQQPSGVDDNRYTLLGKRVQTARKNLSCAHSNPLYTLRHTVITQMTEAGHPEWLREAIVGHESGSVIGKHYVKSESLQLMLGALNTVTYGALDEAITRCVSSGAAMS